MPYTRLTSNIDDRATRWKHHRICLKTWKSRFSYPPIFYGVKHLVFLTPFLFYFSENETECSFISYMNRMDFIRVPELVPLLRVLAMLCTFRLHVTPSAFFTAHCNEKIVCARTTSRALNGAHVCFFPALWEVPEKSTGYRRGVPYSFRDKAVPRSTVHYIALLHHLAPTHYFHFTSVLFLHFHRLF